MAQQRAAPAAHAADQPEHGEAGKTVGADAAAAIDAAVDEGGEFRPLLDVAADAGPASRRRTPRRAGGNIRSSAGWRRPARRPRAARARRASSASSGRRRGSCRRSTWRWRDVLPRRSRARSRARRCRVRLLAPAGRDIPGHRRASWKSTTLLKPAQRHVADFVRQALDARRQMPPAVDKAVGAGRRLAGSVSSATIFSP